MSKNQREALGKGKDRGNRKKSKFQTVNRRIQRAIKRMTRHA